MNPNQLAIAKGTADLYKVKDELKKDKFKKEPNKRPPKQIVGWSQNGDTKLDEFLKFQNKVEQGW